MSTHFDVAVIGSGFGGSVTAMRLTEKGYRVLVIEAGARFADSDFAKTSWNVKKFLYFPALGLRGIQRINFLSNVMILSGAGVGGGSLVYANTLYKPEAQFFESGTWAGMANWRDLLDPHYAQAESMLGVVTNPYDSPSDAALRRAADSLGYGDTYRAAPVGIFFGQGSGKRAEDPFFGGVGPARAGCTNCGECMTGCRHGAKNTLVKNYLYLAEKAGAQVLALTRVDDLERIEDGWRLSTRRVGPGGLKATFTAEQVVVSAGALGTARLLQSLRDRGRLPGLSQTLGAHTRTNSESLLGVISKDKTVDYSLGSAITSSVFPASDTHVEPVRYGRGSNLMATLQVLMASGRGLQSPNPLRLIGRTLTNIHRLPSFYNFRHWSERTVILLVMQARDNSLTTYLKRGLFGKRLSSRQGHGEANPSWVPAGHVLASKLADQISGTAGAVVTEAFGMPLTAHFLGGATIGPDASRGVVDGYLRAYGEPGLHIIDGSVLSANPGVNPSLSITALAEWACACWPNRGETDQRPELGESFVELDPIKPVKPIVPRGAPAALRMRIR